MEFIAESPGGGVVRHCKICHLRFPLFPSPATQYTTASRKLIIDEYLLPNGPITSIFGAYKKDAATAPGGGPMNGTGSSGMKCVLGYLFVFSTRIMKRPWFRGFDEAQG